VIDGFAQWMCIFAMPLTKNPTSIYY